MIIAVHRNDADPMLLDQMYRLRAKCFLERRGWRVQVRDGKEIDSFDQLNPLYLISVGANGHVLGSLRLLQTTGPHMLADVFPEVLGGEPITRHPLVWESTRFCVDADRCQGFAQNGISLVTSELLEGLFYTAQEVGLESVLSVYDLYMERILKRAGCVFERFGQIARYDKGLKTVAGLFEVGPHVTESIQNSRVLKTTKPEREETRAA